MILLFYLFVQTFFVTCLGLIGVSIILMFVLSVGLLSIKKSQMYREQVIQNYAEEIFFVDIEENSMDESEYIGLSVLDTNLCIEKVAT